MQWFNHDNPYEAIVPVHGMADTLPMPGLVGDKFSKHLGLIIET
jgi:hypothetical protein